VILRFSGTLLRHVDYEREIDVDAPTLHAALDGIVQRYPSIRSSLLDGDGKVRAVHRLFLNSEPVDRGADLATVTVARADVVDVVTALAGG
jgi:molybdopterin synthase sulfur carrier subunit